MTFAHRAALVLVSWCFKRPVNDQRSPADHLTGSKSPEAAVPALLAVITHNKVSPCGNHELAVLYIVLDFGVPAQSGTGQILARRGRERIAGAYVIGRKSVTNVRFILLLAVHEQPPVINADSVTGHADYTLHEVFTGFLRFIVGGGVFEYNDVSAADISVRQHAGEARANREDEFVHQQLIANQ